MAARNPQRLSVKVRSFAPLAFSVSPMSSPLYTVLNLFESPRGHLAEISRTLRHAQQTWGNEWIWIEPRHAMTLSPLDGHAPGAFAEGQLYLRENGGELRWTHGRTEALNRIVELPAEARKFLEVHLS